MGIRASASVTLTHVSDGLSPIAVILYTLGDLDGPFNLDSNRVADEDRVLSDAHLIVGTGSPWSEEQPTPSAGEVVWMIMGYYTPPQTWPSVWSDPVRMTGAAAKAITLFANPSMIQVTARDAYKQTEVIITAYPQNLSGVITWTVSDGSWEDLSGTAIELDATTVTDDRVMVTATIGDFSASISIGVVVSGDDAPHNFGGVTTIPEFSPYGKLLDGDYFLWAGPTDETYTRGQIYERRLGYWILSTNRDLVMTMFDSFADLANDVDTTVMGNVVIKKLVAIEAFIQSLLTQDLEITNSGQIRQNYDKHGNLIDEDDPGFYLGRGLLKANHASLIGSLKTGHNAPGGARISATDTAGFAGPVRFTGSGLNDMVVFKEGVLQTGDWTVRVTQTGVEDILEYAAVPWRSVATIGSSTWYGVAYYNGVWIAVNAAGLIRSTNNGLTWSSPVTHGSGWSSIAVHNGTWVIVGYNKWSKSTDGGLTWSTPANISSSSDGYFDIAINGNAWVAVGRTGDSYSGYGYIAVSTNEGASWSLESSTGTNYFKSVAVYGDTFIAVGRAGNGVSGSQAISNNNGASWSISNSYARRFYAVTVSDGVWGRVSDGVNNFYEIARSTNNGASWSTQTVSYTAGTTSWYEDIIAHGSLWLLIGSNGALRVSFDSGISWSAVYNLGSGYWSSGCISDYGIVIGGRDGIMSGKVLLNAIYDTVAVKGNGGSYGPDIPLYPKQVITIAGDTNIGFDAIAGHTVGNTWTFTKTALSALKLTDRFDYTYFDAVGGEVLMRNYRYITHLGSVVFTRANNQIVMTDIVIVLALEKGDVIRVTGTISNNGIYTVETISNNHTIVVNYAHRNGAGSLSLTNETINCNIELIAKWHSAPIGLGQAWVSVGGGTSTFTNSTGRAIQVALNGWIKEKTTRRNFYVDGVLVAAMDYANTGSVPGYAFVIIPANSTYYATASNAYLNGWLELR